MKNITGSPVEGENFFGREKELAFAWQHIQQGNSLKLPAPRRVGKSSFAKELLNYAKKEGWRTLEINLEQIKTERDFVKILIDKLEEQNWWEKAKNKTGKATERILSSFKPAFETDGIKVSLEYQKIEHDIYEHLKALFDHEEATLIMVDELTILLNSFLENDAQNGKRDVEFFLNWLRSFRQISGTKIRWIFCSSIGIENFTNQHGLSHTLNDVTSFKIDEFPREKAFEFVRELGASQNLKINEALNDYILNKIAWYLPYFIQELIFKISILVSIYDKTLSEETIDEAYSNLINESHLNTWDERLKEYKELDPYFRLILNSVSKVTEGENRQVLKTQLYAKINDEEKTNLILSQVLTYLKNDGYLIVNSYEKYVFRSPLLRDFWNNRFNK
jgi:uncharacterized protein